MPRTNIVIDAALMEQARAAAGTRTMRETVERALHALIREQRLQLDDARARSRSLLRDAPSASVEDFLARRRAEAE
jgi:Arc/MetJ family transcription regulator